MKNLTETEYGVIMNSLNRSFHSLGEKLKGQLGDVERTITQVEKEQIAQLILKLENCGI